MSKNYYLLIETSQAKYGTVQTNDLDFYRLIQQKPYWKQIISQTIQKQKVLVINAPDARNWDNNQCIVAAEQFKKLQDEGFKLFVCQNEGFSELKTSSLTSPKKLFDSLYQPDEENLKKAAKHFELSVDEVFVLNQDELAELFNGIQEELIASPSEYLNLNESTVNIPTLSLLLEQYGSQIKGLNLSQCVNLRGGTLPEKLVLPMLEEFSLGSNSSKSYIQALERSYERITNMNEASIRHIINASPNIRILNLPSYKELSEDTLIGLKTDNLETLDVSNTNISEDDLHRIFSTASRLKSLNLVNLQILSGDLLSDLSAKDLESLDLSSSNISSSALAKLLANAPNIKELKLESCKMLGDYLMLAEPLNLEALEKLKLNGSNISSFTLGELLANATSLKTLSLNYCSNLNADLNRDLNLSFLNKLNLSESNVSSQVLGKLLAKASKLEELNLKRCKNINDNLDLAEPLNLEALEILNLYGSNISSSTLGELLTNAPSLKTLSLNYCDKLSADLNRDLNLASLEQLDLSYSNVSSQVLSKLLAKTSKLKGLSLRRCENINDNLELVDPINLESLEILVLYGSNISASSLGDLLTNAPSLKTLSLNYCSKLNTDLNRDLNLASLEQLDLSDSNVSIQVLSKFLAKASKLKELNLKRCKNINDNLELAEPVNLEVLEILTLYDSNISSSTLGELLTNASSLKKLDLHNCDNLSDVLNRDLNLASLEELNLRNSNVSNQVLSKFLAKASKLKNLELNNCKNINDNLELAEPLNLEALEILTLYGSNISASTLGELLANASSLKTLSLSGCTNLSAVLNRDLNLASLEGLDLGATNVSSQVLGKLLAKASKLKNLDLNNCKNLSDNLELAEPLNLEALEVLKLGVSSNISSSTLGELLANASSLKQLSVHNATNLSDHLNRDLNLASLEELRLKNSNVSSQVLSKLLAKASKLKTLDLDNCKNLRDNLDQAGPLNLKALETLSLGGTSISSSTLGELLTNASSLKTLSLINCTNLSADLDRDLNLESLEELDLTDSNVSSQVLSKLLAKAPKLKKLNLEGCRNISSDLIGDFDLSSLETINLFGSTISSQGLSKLLSNASSLQTLNLETLNRFNDELPQELNLVALERLEIVDSDISSGSMSKLLAKSTKLKKLLLGDCVNLSENLSQNLSFTELSTVTIGNSNISYKSLADIFNQTSELVNIDFYGYNNFPENVDDLDLNCAKLESLKVTYSNINNSTLNIMLENASKLKSLTVKNCQNLNGELSHTLNLESLEILDIQGSSFSSKDLGVLLANAKNIKTISLANCQNLTDDFVDEIDLKSLDEIIIEGSNINPAIIEKIKRKAPDTLSIRGKSNFYIEESAPIKENSEGLVSQIFSGSIFSGWFDKPASPESNISQKSVQVRKKTNTNAPKNLDANTTYDLKKHDVTKIFYSRSVMDPATKSYRLSTFNDYALNEKKCDIGSAFQLRNKSPDLELIDCNPIVAPEDLYSSFMANVDLVSSMVSDFVGLFSKQETTTNSFYGKQTLMLSKDWQPLASLSPEEVMTHYHLSHPAEVDLKYSKRDNLYYIRRKPNSQQTENPITIDWILQVTTTPDLLPKDIQAKIDECKKFGTRFFKMDAENLTGAEYLAVLEQEKMGACRHRSLVFKDWMVKNHPEIECRIVENDSHEFVEILHNKRWVTYDLGGYFAITSTHEPNKPTLKSSKTIDLTAPNLKKDLNTPIIKKVYFSKENAEKNPLAAYSEPKLYMQHLLSSEGQKKLMSLKSKEAITGFRHQLQNYCKETSRPCFYIQSPEDLMCFGSFIKREGTMGHVQPPGFGGPLHQFLNEHQDDKSKPVLIINYDRFSTKDIIRFNALLDDTREADGSPLPIDAQIIGLINPDNPQSYQGRDFLSRFDGVIPNTLAMEKLRVPPITQGKRPVTEESCTINLYGGRDWENKLLGYWVMNGQELHFIEGELITALKEGKTHIDLKNAPWQDEAFQDFWQQALLYGSFHSNDQDYNLPKDFKITQSQGYSWLELCKNLNISNEDKIPANAYVLNPGLFSKFLGIYTVDDKNNSIQYENGLLEKHQGKSIDIYLSDTLPSSVWAAFLDKCSKYKVKANVTLAPGVGLPKELLLIPEIKLSPTLVKEWIGEIPASAYVQSNDLDASLASLQSQAIIIDVSEVSPADLLVKLDGKFDKEKGNFTFTKQDGALLTALKNKQTVILKGQIQDDLRYALTEFLLDRSRESTPEGRLLIMSDKQNPFAPIVQSFKQEIGLAQKKALLPENSFDDETINKENFVKLKTMLRYRNLYPEKAKDPWAGYISLPPLPIHEELDLDKAEELVTTINQKRYTGVNDLLRVSPFGFLAGMTGAGKTTFIDEIWKKQHPAVHIGIENLLKWATDESPGYKTLFLDEANITPGQWSMFEGLFNDPPGILIGNRFVPLSPDHKVIFAGNPLSYGGERQMASLFARHGNAVIFDPLPPAYLFQTILKPIFAEANLNALDCAKPILEVAQALAGMDNDKVLITPRELSMMAILTQSHCLRHPTANPVETARYYAYNLAQSFVPKDFKNSFDLQFKPSNPLEYPTRPNLKNFVLTPANQHVFDALSDLLELRELRQKNIIKAEGGLGGIIIEGEPGVGKTKLVIEALLAYGLKKGNLAETTLTDEQVFYNIPIGMSYEKKRALLLKAFREGSVVVMDEINTSPMMEELLNNLLMGKDPEGNPAPKPGFMLFGTGNDAATMAGRLRATAAISHRTQKIIFPEYAQKEMVNILEHRGLPLDISEEMTTQYQRFKVESPTMCFRDLLNRADLEITALSKSKNNEVLETKEYQEQLKSHGFFGENTNTQNRPQDDNLDIIRQDIKI